MGDSVPTFLSLFSGVGGFDFALERLGFRCVGQVENDPYCNRVLERRWPGVARWADVRAVGADDLRLDGRRRDRQDMGREVAHLDGRQAGENPEPSGQQDISRVDLLVGGFPCQGASVAGKRLGLVDDRTALFWEICRIQKVIRAPWALLENVPGLRSVRLGHDFPVVLAALKELWPVVGWRTLDSRFFNVPQRRERIYFVCGPDEARVAQVLFEPEGGGGDSSAGGEAGARVAAILTSGSHRAGVNESGRRAEDDVNLVVSTCIQERYGKGVDSDCTQTLVVGSLGARERGRQVGVDEVAGGQLVVGSLGGGSRGLGRRSKDDPNLVYQQHGSDVGKMGALRSGHGDVQSGVPFITHPLKSEGHDGSEDGTGRGVPLVAPTLGAYGGRRQIDQPYHVEGAMTVRRLTPTETARLQAFPDGWCCLCQPLDVWAIDPETAAERCTCPDSPQYKCYGNAVTTTVISWLAERLMRVLTVA